MIDSRFVIYQKIALIFGIVTLLLGTVVIWAWTQNILVLAQLGPGWVAMKVNTALGFVLAGAAILCLIKHEQCSIKQTFYCWLARGCAAALILMGTLTCIEYLFGIDLHIDQLLWIQTAEHTESAVAGRMSPFTAAMQINFGIALFLLSITVKGRQLLLNAVLLSAESSAL